MQSGNSSSSSPRVTRTQSGAPPDIHQNPGLHPGYCDFNVPFGSTPVIAVFSTFTCTLSAISTVR